MPKFLDYVSGSIDGRPLKQGLPDGRILFRIGSHYENCFLVHLSPSGCRVSSGVADADLTVYCHDDQLEEMFATGTTETPIRFYGRSELLASLAKMLGPISTPVYR